jgi:hypothetical protein
VVPVFLGKGFGPSNAPRIATGVSFLIALTAILLGNINVIAPVLSMFSLTSYGVLHLISGLEGMIGNPSWRPTFRTLWLLSLLGAGLCVAAMFMINAGATFISKVAVGDDRKESLEKSVKGFLRKRRITALVEVLVSEDTISGARELVRTYGLGPFAPNTFVLGETEKEEQFMAFADLILLLSRSRKNGVIVREARSVPEEKGIDREILVWWGEKQQNAGLMLAFGYMLQSTPEWRKARLVLNTIVRSAQERKKTADHLCRFLAEGRIPAEVRVLVETAHKDLIPTTVKQFSAGADLVFLGMRTPEERETAEEYAAYDQTLMKSTQDFPTLVLVLAAEEIEFKKIFR